MRGPFVIAKSRSQIRSRAKFARFLQTYTLDLKMLIFRYAWTICQCKYCDSHMGWKFTASTSGLIPKKFWGLSRRSIHPKFKVDPEKPFEETEQNEEENADSIA